MKISRLALLVATAGAAAMVAAACGPNGSSPNPAAGNIDWKHPSFGGGGGTPGPTPTPSGAVYLDNFFPNGTNKVSAGKCLGFEVVGNTVSFDPVNLPTVSADVLGTLPVTFIDSNHLQVGDPATSNTCVFTPPFGKTGPLDVTVAVATSSYRIAGGVILQPPVIYNLGSFTSASPRMFTQAKFSGASAPAGVDVFETPYDVDIYMGTFSDFPRNYPHADFFDLSGKGVVPQIEFWNISNPSWTSPLGVGAFSSIFPEDGTDYFVVKDIRGQGGPGVSYDLSVVADTLGDTATGSTCSNAPEIAPGGYHIPDATLVNNFNPDGNSGCFDTWFGTPIYGPGPDAVWKVTVPAGKTMRFASYDNHWTNSLYMLPSTSSCDPMPTDCVEAMGHFGGGNVNALDYTNSTTSDQSFFVVWDAYALNTSMTPDDGAFLVNFELFDHK